MRNLTVIFFLLVFSGINSFAQQYYPLADSNAIWTVGFSDFGGGPGQGNFTRIYLGGDTTINQIDYKKTYAVDYSNYWLYSTSQYLGAIREDGKKWLYIDHPNTQEKLLYDFDVTVNDTLTINSYHDRMYFLDSIVVWIVSIDSILIDSVYRKKITVSPLGGTSTIEYWIEGIGSKRGVLFAKNCWGFDCGATLECYKEDGKLLYHNSSFPDACQDLPVCISFAGNDTVVCASEQPVLYGAVPVGGFPPYSYSWNYSSGNLAASDLLDDTTKLHPTIVYSTARDSIVFTLVITDSVGNSCGDVVKVNFRVPPVTTADDTINIITGDSVELGVRTIAPQLMASFQWEPATNLSSQDSLTPKAFPTVTTTYTLSIIDIGGCYFSSSVTVVVGEVGIGVATGEEVNFSLFPLPAKNEVFLETDRFNNYEALLLDLQGKIVRTVSFSGASVRLNTEDLTEGVYLIQLRQEKKIIGTRKLVKL